MNKTLTTEERRRQENADLLDRMRRGESLARYDARATWFQPRALIKKDPAEMARVYGEDDGQQ